MAFVQAKCENCGAILSVDSNLKAAICEHCGTAYVVQDSINYYNSVTQVEHMHADVVNISDEKSAKGRLNAAKAFMKLGKYKEAEVEYKKVTDLTPQDYVGWFGLIESGTHQYTKRIQYKSEFRTLEDYAHSVEVFAPEDTSKQLLQPLREYLASEREKNQDVKSEFQSQIQELYRKIDDIDSKVKKTRDDLMNIDIEHSNAEAKMFHEDSKTTVIQIHIIGIISGIIVGLMCRSMIHLNAVRMLSVLICWGFSIYLIIRLALKQQATEQYDVLGAQQNNLNNLISQLHQQKLNVQEDIERVKAQLDMIE